MSGRFIPPRRIYGSSADEMTASVRRGFSLIEMAVALSVTSILLVAVGSAMVLASRAVPDGTGATAAVIEAGDVLTRLSTELQHSQHLVERTSQVITFTVADRTGNGSPERIRYAWSGEPGDPLTRQVNDETPAVVAAEVAAWSLAYHQADDQEAYPGPAVEGSEETLATVSHLLSLSTHEYGISGSQSISQYVEPKLADDVLYWRPTQVQFYGRSGSLFGRSYRVAIRYARLDEVPEEETIVSTNTHSSLLSLLSSWHAVSLEGAPRLRAGEAVTIVFDRPSGSGTALVVEAYDDSLEAGLALGDGEGSWNYRRNETLRHRLRGRLTRVGPTQVFDRRFIEAIDVTLQARGAEAMETQVELANRPEMLAKFWRADFRHDPTTLDLNADQQPDWVVDGSFNSSRLDNGIWHADRTLYANAVNALAGPMRVRLRLRHAYDDGGAVVLRLEFDRIDGALGHLAVTAQRRADGSQTLTLRTQDNDGVWHDLATAVGLGSDFIDVRLLIDPEYQTVHMRVNDANHGTHTYMLRSALPGAGQIALEADGHHAEYEYVEVALSE